MQEYLTPFRNYQSFVIRLCMMAMLALMSVSSLSIHAAQVTAVRVWPSGDYSRITLEANRALKYQVLEVPNPDRVVMDIEGVSLDEMLKSLSTKVLPNDPFIKSIRLGHFKENVVRVVVDLKTKVEPKTIELKPIGEYQHRLVLDLYPPKDAVMALLDARNRSATPGIANVNKGAEDTAVSPKDVIKPNITVKPSFRHDDRELIVAIDAGHGGEDPGARGATGTYEKDVTLAIAKKLKEKIDRIPNMRGVLIRDGDYFIKLYSRVEKARQHQADLFVSIHADSFDKETARGSSVFALSERGATSVSAKFLAQKENNADLIGGVSLDNSDSTLNQVIFDLAQTATINDSLILGKAVLNQIGEINTLHKPHVEQAAFVVLKAPDIPSILVETAFISNREEERKLNNSGYQDKLANSILTGIKQYFAGNPALAKRVRQEVLAKE